MRTTIGCGSLLLASCCGCCCLRIPTFGLGPEVDPAPIRAELLARPVVVQHTCRVDEVCSVVEEAEIDVVPIGWNPITGTVVSLVAVEARCAPSTELRERLESVLCAGVLASVAMHTEAGLVHRFVAEDTVFALEDLPPGYVGGGGGGDWDWD